MVNYADFLRSLEQAARKAAAVSDDYSLPLRTIRSRRSYEAADDISTAGGLSLSGMYEPIRDREQPPLTPPKLSETLPTERVSRQNRFSSSSSSFRSPKKRYWSIDDPPRSPIRSSMPPAKVGSKMWGSHTPLQKKGRAPRLGEGKWCCKVCMYVDNEDAARKCTVCDCPKSADDPVRKNHNVPCNYRS